MTKKKENNILSFPPVDGDSKKINILMTGGGAPGAAGILKCLQVDSSFQVSVADADPEALGKYLHTDFEVIPFADDPGFADCILSLCRRKEIKVVMPLVTSELIPLSKHLKEFEQEGTRLLISLPSSLEIANNKSRLYEFLQWRSIPVPDFRVVETAGQFTKAVYDLGYPQKQVCFKPSVSNGSRGFRIIGEQINELDLLFNHKPNSTFLRLDDGIRILSSGPFPELLVSEYLPGEEYSVDCLADHGESVVIVPRLRTKMMNGISVAGQFVKEENIIHYCRQIIKELQLHGNIGIQVKRSAAGQFLILEINPRVQGSIASGLGAGINLPVLAVKKELGLAISAEEIHVKWGASFTKYWDIVFH